MVYIGNDTFVDGPAMADSAEERTLSVPGAVSAAIWAIGLAVGLVALAAGHELLAGVSLVLAIMSPWFGLAWVSHAQRADMRRARAMVDQVPTSSGHWPTLQVAAG